MPIKLKVSGQEIEVDDRFAQVSELIEDLTNQAPGEVPLYRP